MDATVWLELAIKMLFLILGTVLTTYIIPWIRDKQLETIIIALVKMAEQTLKTTSGPNKKKFVLEWLKKHNINYDESYIDAVLESAVYNMKNEAQQQLIIGEIEEKEE